MIPKKNWIWFDQNIGRDHVVLAPHAKFSQSTAVGKFVINTIGEISSSLDGKPVAVFPGDSFFQTVVFSLNRDPRGSWDADYVKGPLKITQYKTKEEAVAGHLSLCNVYAKRSVIKKI